MPPAAPPWVVLKFGGTSVATPERWGTIASLAERRRAEGLRPLLVCSALAGISSRLDEMLSLAVEDRHDPVLAEIRDRHLELGKALGLPVEDLFGADFDELSRLTLAVSLLREAGPRLRARVLAFGELMSTRLGAAFLNARIPTAWLDARSCLVAREDPRIGPRAYLS
ncbi:MAG: bifunctional aspartate kinase/diaminopimelate decarboxylase, partial [Thermoanaerobaculia bacterium]